MSEFFFLLHESRTTTFVEEDVFLLLWLMKEQVPVPHQACASQSNLAQRAPAGAARAGYFLGLEETCAWLRKAASPCLNPNGKTERLQGFRRDPLRDKIREVGRGLSLADTQTGR